ncbi:hypothetical protein [Streptosporangium saharense]|uniref:Serine/threonine protein kinase n=1 Tax=Streptosporangium saharense TaxID=1706840 RepID=A0A7W7QSJ8_9ACTN|nr:hypothetical protein [Streptosporangium saharense]MBB4918416.1 hypothetical protein [Streptosporangium saharense]
MSARDTNIKAAWVGAAATVLAAVISLVGVLIFNSRGENPMRVSLASPTFKSSPDHGSSIFFSGTWTGTATHPTAALEFPVNFWIPDSIQSGTESGVLRWAEELHCFARLRWVGGANEKATLDLKEVTGKGCYAGRLTLVRQADNEIYFEVTRQGESAPRYLGRLSRK